MLTGNWPSLTIGDFPKAHAELRFASKYAPRGSGLRFVRLLSQRCVSARSNIGFLIQGDFEVIEVN
jgi:hypothetical protein